LGVHHENESDFQLPVGKNNGMEKESAMRGARLVMPFAVVMAAFACSSSSTDPGGSTPAPDGGTNVPSGSTETGRTVLRQYATNVRAGYAASLEKARVLKTAIDAFVAAPSQATLDAARAAWIAAREPYGRTEAYRFYGGPIDDEKDGPEGRINGWPLDENVVDYTKDDPNAGIINHLTEFPTIDVALVRDENEKGGEKNITCGYHAIEFLLWGQDTVDTAGGARPFTDYVVGNGATAKNQDRRRAYLQATAGLLVEDLEKVHAAWDLTVPTSYGSTFVALADKEGFEKMLTGIAALSGIELSRERLNNAFETQDQEEEHSCFSDNTKADLLANAKGIQDVYLGLAFDGSDGPGLDELVKAKDPALDTKIKTAIADAVAAVDAIPAPFDKAISDPNGRTKINDAILKTKTASDALLEAGRLYDLRISLSL
jgi:putative iron-regulated protein